jgi:Ca2+-binding RTX toxin-like protein
MGTRTILGTTDADLISAPDGHDPSLTYDNIVQGYGGNDTISGGSGNDWIWGSTSNPGADYFTGGGGDDVLVSYYGGTDTTSGVARTPLLDGGTGNDILILGSHNGSASGNAVLLGGDGNDQLWAFYGEVDYQYGSTASTYLNAGSGNDFLAGGGLLNGGTGDDTLVVGGAVQGFSGGQGSFTIFRGFLGYGDDGNDTLYAASGINQVTLNGDSASYDPYLGTYTSASRHPGADTLVGNGQGDTLNGGEGPNGGDGRTDVLIGANGQDNFVLTSAAATPAVDLIWNFEVGIDHVSDQQSGDSARHWVGASATYLDSYAASQPDGSVAALSGTMLSSSDGTELGFFVGQHLTFADLLSSGSLV